MSKIPQGEWNAIAARHAQGETISQIARSYSCTPPAIHYILKRSGQRTAETDQPWSEARPEPAPTFARETARLPVASATTRPTAPHHEQHDRPRWSPGERQTAPGRTNELPAALRPVQSEQRPAITLPQSGGHPDPAARTSAFTAGLDSELHARAEVAIEKFRSSFNAALAEGTPDVREELRQAASDLMRVAARTTIVLDRLNAGAERMPTRLQDYARSTRAREHAA